MYDHKRVLETVKVNSTKEFNCIPVGFDRCEPYFPGILPATYYIVTANSGIGKSKFVKDKFIYQVIKFFNNNPGYNGKIFYFSLEESKEEFILSVYSKLLFEKYNIVISPRDLLSIRKNRLVNQDIIQKMESFDEWFENFFQHVEVIDNITNAFGIYSYIRDYMHTIGTPEYEEIEIGGDKQRVLKRYTKNDPNFFVEAIVDHLSLLTTDKQSATLREAMGLFSSRYCVRLRNIYGCTMVNVQQQAADKEKQEFFRGQSITTKLEPSLDSLADNRTTQRDANIVYGLFAPDRYEINKHIGYDIVKLQDRFRQLSILKDRGGNSNVRVGLYFKGEVDYFEELPHYKTMNENPTLYEKYLNK